MIKVHYGIMGISTSTYIFKSVSCLLFQPFFLKKAVKYAMIKHKGSGVNLLDSNSDSASSQAILGRHLIVL